MLWHFDGSEADMEGGLLISGVEKRLGKHAALDQYEKGVGVMA